MSSTTAVSNNSTNELQVLSRGQDAELELRWKLPTPLSRLAGIAPCAITGEVTFDLDGEGSALSAHDIVLRDFPSVEAYQFTGTGSRTLFTRSEGSGVELCALR